MTKLRNLITLFFVIVATSAMAQTKTVTGTVTDETGNALPGVSVIVEGTGRGTITDNSGVYSISVNSADQIQFRFVGMQMQTQPVDDRTTINVVLRPEVTEMEQVVVVGYGTQKKESIVGSISQTTGEDVKLGATGGTELSTSLTGLLPGVVTIRTSGVPGGSSTTDDPTEIFIRGQTTWNYAQPLILVDGVERRMDDVDPNEVESISVLKDASATAVFGVKGANGVILITTRRGKTGKPVLSFESLASAVTISKRKPLLGSYDSRYLKNLAVLHEISIDENAWGFFTPPEFLNYFRTQEYPELFPDINWLEESTKDFAISQRHNMSVSGGTEFVNYFLSLGYLTENDIMNTQDLGQGYNPQYKYDRYNFRSNLDFNLTNTTRLSVNLAGYHGRRQEPGQGSFVNRMMGLYTMPPDVYPVQYSDGTWAFYEGFDRYPNPLYHLNFKGVAVENRTELTTDFVLQQKLDFITKGLSVSGKFSYDNRANSDGPDISHEGVLQKYIGPGILDARTASDSARHVFYVYPTSPVHGYNYVPAPISTGSEEIQNNIYRSLFYQVSINYARVFGEHSVSALALMNRREHTTGANFTNYREDWVGRVTYDYGGRYFLEINGAYNGSEKFDRIYRFGFFPSLAGGWMLSNEEFFKSTLPFVNIMKLRYSWGQIGNDGGIPRWQYVSGWNRLSGNDAIHSFGSPVLQPAYNFYIESVVANPDIRWETAEKQNIGIETGFFKSLVRFNFDYFWEHRYDMFIDRADRLTNVVFGKDLPATNIGELKSHGWEAELRFSRARPDFRIWANLHWAYAANEVIYREDPELRPGYQQQAGYPIGQRRSYISSDIIQSWDEVYTGVVSLDNQHLLPGDFRRVDYNADGVIDGDDIVPYQYTTQPQYNYGLTTGFQYKKISGRIQFYGVYNVTDTENFLGEFHENYSIAAEHHLTESWSPEMERTLDATYPHLRLVTGSNKANYMVKDFSYLRIQMAEIGYAFGGPMLSSAGISQFRLFLSGNNLWVWNQLNEDRDQSAGNRFYPMTRRVNLGVNLTF